MWLVASFKPVSLFSLRMSLSTSSGGKTLLVPTPYAFKLAIVDAAFRMGGERLARDAFEMVKNKKIRFRPPEYATINHTFIKVLKEKKEKSDEEFFNRSIAFREYCYFSGIMEVAIEATNDEASMLSPIIMHINYFGKRGGFFQFIKAETVQELGKGFSKAVPEEMKTENIVEYCVAQFLDDLGATDTKDLFERINTYMPEKKVELDRHRVIKQYLLPYREEKTTRNYAFYKRTC